MKTYLHACIYVCVCAGGRFTHRLADYIYSAKYRSSGHFSPNLHNYHYLCNINLGTLIQLQIIVLSLQLNTK